MKLHQKQQHKTVIACLQAAIKQGQAQPWMYEVLALSMEIEGYPKKDIERVVLSLSDFGAVSFESLMYSAAYLKRFDRDGAALKLYQQASRLSPERHEPYVLALPLAEKVGELEDIRGAAEGILQHYWGDDHRQQHRLAEDAIFNQLRKLKREGQQDQMQALAAQLKQARIRDLMIRVEWSGAGDLDLDVEEPPGSVCSFETPLTIAGGIFLHDGTGPLSEESYESYVCPQAVTGTYRVTVKKSFGKVVGDRATVQIKMHSQTEAEKVITRTVVFEDGEASFTFDLENGRRTQPRQLSLLRRPEIELVVDRQPKQLARMRADQSQVLQQFSVDRLGAPAVRGGVGYAPVVQTLQEGSSLSARAVVSPDRKYVRLSLNPTFTNITDVFTFSFLNSGQQNNNR